MKKSNIKIYVIFIILISIITLLMIRKILPTQVDDVSPGIECSEEILEKADVYYIVPNFKEKNPINNNLKWCEKIRLYNKEYAMHGINHPYKEFEEKILEKELIEAINIFEECIGKKPEKFKPPQLSINKENKKLIKKYFDLDTHFNQLFHKVYHCSDTGIFSNKIISMI